MRLGIDIGGTFTDFVLCDEAGGELQTHKLLSTPDDPAHAVFAGLSHLLHGDGPVPLSIVHGSTVATNALLERKGARTAFVATAGFRDLLTIGRQNRSHLHDFGAGRPAPLIPPERCFEVNERVDHRGHVLMPLAADELPALVAKLRAEGVEAVAVCLLFSFLHPEHEQAIAAPLSAAGIDVSISSDILPAFREYERASTTAINAYVSPVMDRYIGRLAGRLGAHLRIMQSNGGSLSAGAARRQAVRCILSGPAGGAVGALQVARIAGYDRVLTFDMGGTSTDVSLLDGDIRVTSEAEIGGLPIGVPVIDIHTVGAGGGSLAGIDVGGALQVGPQSAGADPGPACYGRGGVLTTVTDANLVLGRLPAEHFLGGQMPLDTEAGAAALDALARQAGVRAQDGLSAGEAAALGVVQIANAHMERALRVISVERGYDPADFTLVSFGGAGGLHACDLARSLGMRRVLIPPTAAVLSAFGMLVADVVKDDVQTVMLSYYPETLRSAQSDRTVSVELERLLAPLMDRCRSGLLADGVPASRIELYPQLDMRYRGQSYELTIPFTDGFLAAFHAGHERLYGHSDPEAPIEIVNVRVRGVGKVDPPSLTRVNPGPSDPTLALLGQRRVVQSNGTAVQAPLYDGGRLRPGHRLSGPALVVQPDTTILLAAGDAAEVDPWGNLVVTLA